MSALARVIAVICAICLSLGASLPYMSLWLESKRGLDGPQIALILASAGIARLVTGPLLMMLPHRLGGEGRALSLLAGVAAGFYALLWAAPGFSLLFLFAFIAQSCAAAAMPLVEAQALNAGRSGKVPYGPIRGAGSAAFIAGSVSVGWLVGQFGADAALATAIFGLAATAILAQGLPNAPAARHRGPLGSARATWRQIRQTFANRPIRWLFFTATIVQSSHALYYSFGTPIWIKQGFAPDFIGLLWATGTGIEIIFLLLVERYLKNIRAETWIALGGIGAIVRWLGLAFSPGPIFTLGLQSLHAATFAMTHIGTMKVIAREVPPAEVGGVATLFFSVSTGTVIGSAMLACGPLYANFGASAYVVMAALGALGLGLTFVQRAQRAQPAPSAIAAPPIG